MDMFDFDAPITYPQPCSLPCSTCGGTMIRHHAELECENGHRFPMRVEDESFPFAGYARVLVDELTEGDAVRFGRERHLPCWQVVTISLAGSTAVVVVVDRAAWVDGLMTDVLGQPVGTAGAGEVESLRTFAFPASSACWVRL